MPLTSTRPVSVYLLNDAADRDQLADTHAKVGWTVAEITRPGEEPGTAVQSLSMQLGPDPIVASFDDVIVSDLVLVQAMTREDYNAAHPDNPLPEEG